MRPITPDKVLAAIRSFPAGKSPGPEGLPIDFYKIHGDLLVPLLESLYSHCLTDGALYEPCSCYPYLQSTSCSSYRPIALLNTDFKILTKLITLRLQPLLHTIIETDQTGFMAHRASDIYFTLIFMCNILTWAPGW